jgi:hypothetical protein
MRGAFVVQLGPETRPTEGQFEGWVEEVDSCTVLRFRSSDELLKFLGARFDLVLASANKDRAGNSSVERLCEFLGLRTRLPSDAHIAAASGKGIRPCELHIQGAAERNL